MIYSKVAIRIFLLCFAVIFLGSHYQARGQFGDQSTTKVANFVAAGLRAYYSVHGIWPESWKDVTDAGLIQVRLINSKGIEIDPDDSNLPATGESVYYSGVDYYNRAILTINQNVSVPPVSSKDLVKDWKIDPVPAYADTFAELAASDGYENLNLNLENYIDDETRLNQFAIVGILEQGVELFKLQYGRTPTGIDELISKGFSCIDRTSINPLTGSKFKFDGSANDIRIRITDNESHPKMVITPIEADGTEIRVMGLF